MLTFESLDESVTIQTKAMRSISLWYCLLCCTCKVVLTFASGYEHLNESYDQYFLSLLLIMLYKVVLTFESGIKA